MAIDQHLFSVFPTCVGVILRWAISSTPSISIPHMRGGDPKPKEEIKIQDEYSPHAWG